MFSSDIPDLEVKAVVAERINGLMPSGIECASFEGLLNKFCSVFIITGRPISADSGGMIHTANVKSGHQLKILRNQRCDSLYHGTNHTKLGYNYHMNEMITALGRT